MEQFNAIFDAAKRNTTVDLKAPGRGQEGNLQEGEKTYHIPLEQIEFIDDDGRSYIDPDWLDEVAASIKERGQDQPGCVRENPDKEKTGIPYRGVWGKTRFRSLHIIEKDTFWTFLRDYTDEEAKEAAAIENLKRKDLNPIDEVDAVLNVLQVRSKLSRQEVIVELRRFVHTSRESTSKGISLSEHYERIGKRKLSTFVTDYLPFLDIADELWKLAKSGKVSPQKVLTLRSIKDEEFQQALIKEIKKKKTPLTVAALEALVRLSKKDISFAKEVLPQVVKRTISAQVLDTLSKHQDPLLAYRVANKIKNKELDPKNYRLLVRRYSK